MGIIGENFGVELDESQKQKEVIDEARNKGSKVHFASLEPQYQKYKAGSYSKVTL